MPRNTPIQSSNGFPRQFRLLSSGDFQQVFKRTEYRSVDQRLTVLARQNDLAQARLGLAISKRIIKTAVGRNRVKRLVRESFRHHQQALSGLDIVVLNRKSAPQANNPELTQALQIHWQRIAKQLSKQLAKQQVKKSCAKG
jgi:ribonuclease P protein component